MNGEKTRAFRVWETGQPGFSVFPYRSQSDLASPKLAGREFELAEETNKVTNGSARSKTPGLHFERARRRREERDPFGWIRDHPRGTKAWHRSVLHVEARDRARPSETNFLFPRSGEVKALGREESGDEGYAAPNPARTRRGSVRCDRRSRYGRVLAPIARRNAARFTRSLRLFERQLAACSRGRRRLWWRDSQADWNFHFLLSPSGVLPTAYLPTSALTASNFSRFLSSLALRINASFRASRDALCLRSSSRRRTCPSFTSAACLLASSFAATPCGLSGSSISGSQSPREIICCFKTLSMAWSVGGPNELPPSKRVATDPPRNTSCLNPRMSVFTILPGSCLTLCLGAAPPPRRCQSANINVSLK
mmetsp:Transcript_10234/g.42277  ORF Transcript_10234/g.42277 Transcript_10234/m.42277 type:complete len:366 (-) Transcript_10234:4604-5701(-)